MLVRNWRCAYAPFCMNTLYWGIWDLGIAADKGFDSDPDFAKFAFFWVFHFGFFLWDFLNLNFWACLNLNFFFEGGFWFGKDSWESVIDLL